MPEKNEITVFENENMFVESNKLIKSRYYASTIENKMLAFGMARLQNKLQYSDSTEVVFSTEEVEMLTGVTDNSRKYDRLKQAASKLNTMHTIIENENKDGFKSMAIVPNCEYRNGEFRMEFNSALKGVLYQVKKDFTPFPLETIASFENKTSSATLRIYQYFKMELQKAVKLKKKTEITLSYEYEEFVLNIGQINTDIAEIKDLVEKKAPAKYIVEKAVEFNKKGVKCAVCVASKADFKRRVLEPAIKEINEKTEIDVELLNYVGKGKSGNNNIILKVKQKPERAFEEGEKYWDCVAGFTDYVQELSLYEDGEDIRKIIKVADADLGRIRDVAEIVRSMDHVRDFTAAMIAGLKEGWDKKKKKSYIEGIPADFYEDIADEVNSEI